MAVSPFGNVKYYPASNFAVPFKLTTNAGQHQTQTPTPTLQETVFKQKVSKKVSPQASNARNWFYVAVDMLRFQLTFTKKWETQSVHQKSKIFILTNHSQGQTAENIVDVLTVIGEGSSGFGETAERSPQHLQLRQRNMPLSCVLLNQL